MAKIDGFSPKGRKAARRSASPDDVMRRSLLS